MSLTLLLLISSIPMLSGSELRTRRSVAPFLGSGGSSSNAMLISRELWHCGSDNNTRNYSYYTAETDCPNLAAALNHCCAIHDDCYGQQVGQEQCDKAFCECNQMVTRLPTDQGYKCRASTNDACVILQILGAFAYGDSSYSDPAKPSANVLVEPRYAPNTGYMDLYSKCRHVNITLASCAVNFDLCSVVHSVDFCASDLCHCMMDAADTDVVHKKQCLTAVAHTCRQVLNHSSSVLSHNKALKLFGIALIVLAVVSIGFAFYFMYNKSYGARKTMDEGKYLQIHTVESSRSVNPLLTNTD